MFLIKGICEHTGYIVYIKKYRQCVSGMNKLDLHALTTYIIKR